jgi:hypothetical protein
VATLVARHADKAVVAPIVGSGGVCVWRDRFCVGAFGSPGEYVFTFNKRYFINFVLSMRF